MSYSTSYIRQHHFTGAGRVFENGSGGLSMIVRHLSRNIAKIAATSVSALTDNSGGATADGTIGAIGFATPAVLGSTDAAQATGLIAAMGTVVDGLKELAAKANQVAAKVPVGTLVDSMTGTAADGTIGAVTTNLTGVGTGMAKASDVNTALTALDDRLATIAHFVDRLANATGQPRLIDNSGGVATKGTPGAAVTLAALTQIAAIGTASGADTTAANAIVKVTDANARLTTLRDAIKEVATTLNAIVAGPVSAVNPLTVVV